MPQVGREIQSRGTPLAALVRSPTGSSKVTGSFRARRAGAPSSLRSSCVPLPLGKCQRQFQCRSALSPKGFPRNHRAKAQKRSARKGRRPVAHSLLLIGSQGTEPYDFLRFAQSSHSAESAQSSEGLHAHFPREGRDPFLDRRSQPRRGACEMCLLDSPSAPAAEANGPGP